jgi:hypothetical protein
MLEGPACGTKEIQDQRRLEDVRIVYMFRQYRYVVLSFTRPLADVVERCLSYDEKPLLLFQKLKESGQKPVFMLRHMVSKPMWPGAYSSVISNHPSP